MKKHLLLLSFFLIVNWTFAQIPINPMIYGQNYWFANHNQTSVQYQPSLNSASYSNVWSDVVGSGARLIRVGGKNFDVVTGAADAKPRATTTNLYIQGYVNIVDDIRKNGCEPVIQVPYDPADVDPTHDLTWYAKQAAEIVRVLNVVHQRNVKYFIIGNEPKFDYGYGYASAVDAGNLTLIANYTKAYAIAMKDIDPEIKLIGVENDWYNKGADDASFTGVYDELFNGTGTGDDLSGLISSSGPSNGQAYIDFMSVHQYVYFSASGLNPDDIYTRLEKIENDIYNSKKFRGVLKDMRDKCNTFNTSSTLRPNHPLKYMITEVNITHNSDDASKDTRSDIGGRLWARMMALGMEYECASLMWFSVKEGCPGGTSNTDDRGYLDGCNATKRGSYYHYSAMAKWFKGQYYPELNLNAKLTSDPLNTINGSNANFSNIDLSNVSATAPHGDDFKTMAFCARNENISVMVLNHGAAVDFSLRLDNGTHSGSATYKFSFGTAISVQESFSGATGINREIGAQSSMLLIFNCSGTLLERWDATGTGDFVKDPLSPDLAVISPPSPPQTITSVVNNNNICLNSGTSGITITSPGTNYLWYKLPSTVPFDNGTSNSVTGLLPGVYLTEISGGGMCESTSIVTVVYHKSPVVDAGPNHNICTGGSPTFLLGNPELPDLSSGNGYSWTSTNSGCTTATGTSNPNKSITGGGCSASANYIITANDGTCSLSDDAYAFISSSSPGDLYMRDSKEDIGSETNNETAAAPGGVYWASPDIWFRQYNDGYSNQISQAVEYSPGVSNYVYVRVRNKGCTSQAGTLHLYWAKASTGLSWLSPCMWDNYNTTYTGCAASAYGDEIGTGVNINIPAGGEQIVEIPWVPVNPNDYSCFTGGDEHHFCLLGRITTSGTPPYGMGITENNDIWQNTKNNNNIVWKNIWITNDAAPFLIANPTGVGAVIIRNVVEKAKYIKLNFVSVKDDIGQMLTDNAKIRLHFTQDFLRRWSEGGKKGEGVVMINDSTIELTSANATMSHIFLPFLEVGGVSVSLKSFKDPIQSKDKYFDFQIVQYSEDIGINTPQGGESYYIKKLFYGEKCATSKKKLNGTIIGTQIFNGGTVQITGNITVPAGAVLKFKDITVLIDENVKIKVLAGGVLTLNHAQLLSACSGKKWKGIIVNGNNLIPTTDLNIKYSNISGTDNPVTIDHVKGMKIIESTFIGGNLGTAITMTKLKDFEISSNTFMSYEIGILSSKTDQALVKSSIEKNIFEDVKIALQFKDDNHSKLDIKCNRFVYSDYAILSDSTNLQDQGVLGEGAGNEFITTSTLPNNKLKHTNGNAAKYYYDPTKPITSGMNITTLSSSLDRTCYFYTFDTTTAVVSRMASPINPIQDAIEKKIIDVYSVPNPNPGQASIYFSLGEANQGELVIMDIYGKIIDRIKLNSEVNKMDVDYSRFANGVYMLALTNNKGEVITRKMVISK